MGTTVKLAAYYNASGQPAYEEVHVEALGGDRYRLLQSPGFAPGLAAGDVFLLDARHDFIVLSRAGNVCVQLFAIACGEELERLATPVFTGIGGWLDGGTPDLRIYTVPYAAGFRAIERAIDAIKARFPELEWYYGNVYDPVDGVTPLNWWLEPIGN